MSYSTMLYAVDINELKSACGSKDAALLERARKLLQEDDGYEPPVDRTKGPRVKVTWKSEIFLNGKLVTPDEFMQALLNPAWVGMNMYLYQETPPPGEQRSGVFKRSGSFFEFMVFDSVDFFQEHGMMFKERYYCVESANSEKFFAKLGREPEEMTEERALEALIAGKTKRRSNPETYAYALKYLCETIGTFLDALGTDQLQSLNLKTQLSKTRSPVVLPKNDDFPYISYLEAAEVQAELTQLLAMDLAYPEDPETERERLRFRELLHTTAQQGRGIVGFYH